MSSSTKVGRVAGWAGWCSPCQREDRPLVLTRSGPGGLGSWLAGLGDDDRLLLLTCAVCGHWQVVPRREQDDPEVVLVDEVAVEAVTASLAAARAVEVVQPFAEAAVVALPAPREVPAAETFPEPSAVDPHVEVPPLPPVPTARRAERIVTVPDTTTLPAFSPEAVAAAARVLTAARAQTQRTAPRSSALRPGPLDRSRRTRGAAGTARTAVRAPRPVVAAAPTSIALPVMQTSQLVLAGGR
jgi:hypothetical protein